MIGRAELHAALRTLGEQDASGASDDVRFRLLHELQAVRDGRRWAARNFAAIAIALLVSTAVPLWHLATLDSPEAEIATAFFPLAYSTVPFDGGRLVRVEVPRESASLFGVEIPALQQPAEQEFVLADVLVGEDGLARAIRFVRRMPPRDRREQQR